MTDLPQDPSKTPDTSVTVSLTPTPPRAWALGLGVFVILSGLAVLIAANLHKAQPTDLQMAMLYPATIMGFIFFSALFVLSAPWRR